MELKKKNIGYGILGNQSFKDKFFSFDFTLVFAILFLGIISIFAMYSTEQGNFGYYTKSHLYRFCIFFIIYVDNR